MTGKVVCWFSCGAPSAVAAKLALQQHPDAVVVRQDTGSEHPDNERFMRDCEAWFGKPVIVTKSDKYRDTWNVWEKQRYIAGVKGARCTGELKRRVAEEYLFDKLGLGAREVFGYTVEEKARVARWQANNTERVIWPILIERGLTKTDCLGIIDRAGIEIPEMYRMGYNNNNCIGCPKGGMGYWNKIRRDFPEVFARMAALERELGVTVCKIETTVKGERTRRRVYLDDLPSNAGNHRAEPDISCGLICTDTADELS